SERKQREEDLAREITKRQILFEQATDAIVVLNQEFSLVEANASFASMLGYPLDEAMKLHPWDWDAIVTTKKQMLALWPELSPVAETFETRWRRRDGTLIDVEISTNPAHLGDQAIL